MQYQWYPGHMTKAKRQMQEDIKLVDLVIELVDARITISSHNPDIDTLGRQKARMVLLNKADLADEAKNKAWCDYYKKQGIFAVRLDARNRGGMKDVQSVIQDACREKIARDYQPSSAGDGRGYSECRKIDIYQLFCGQSLCKDRKQARSNKRQTVDQAE